MGKISHAAVLPLFGGMAYGMSQAFGSEPDFALSWDLFGKNDASFKKNFKSPFYSIDDKDFKGIISSLKTPQVVHCVPPCAGLSMLNSGGNANSGKKRGSEAEQNKWMYNVLEIGMKTLKAPVVVFENAPGLFQKIGDGARKNLQDIAKENGYSTSIVLTDTLLHGVPQSRKRTFAIFWKGEDAPVFQRVQRDRQNFHDFLNQERPKTPEDMIFPYKVKLENDPFMSFILHKYKDDWRSVLNDFPRNLISIGLFLRQRDLFDEAIKWGDKNNEKLSRILRHWKSKLDKGMGYWDPSPLFFKEHTNAIITKNWAIIHPSEDRWLSVREMMSMMGLPNSYSHAQPSHVNAVCQNVPCGTAKDIGLHIKDFLNGKTKSSGKIFYMFDNIKGIEV